MSYNNGFGMGIVRVELNRIDRGKQRIFKDTLAVFRDAVSFVIHVVCDHVDEVSVLDSREGLTFVEHLIHTTKNNEAEYPAFDKIFYKFPSYMRRSAIHAAIGHVMSHETRCIQYYGKREKLVSHGIHYRKMEPAFTYTPNVFPALYKMQSFSDDGCSVKIKVRAGSTWDWITVAMPGRDYRNLMKARALGTLKNPRLVYEYHKYYLEFPVKYRTKKFPETPLEERTILSVDLGLNNAAVCSIVDASGTIHGRCFSPFKADTDRIDHVINLIRKKAASSGKGQSLAALYTKLEGLKDNFVKQLSRWIVDRAREGGVYGIVLEHLGGMKGRGKTAARVHHWCRAKIRGYISGMAMREGIRVFLVNPKNTSALAFDGSGPVTRDNSNYSMCTFKSGKRYHCDLSASYNIGARYFLREYKKSIPETEWSELAAKDPGLSKRTTWTLSTLRSLNTHIKAS